MWVEFVVGSLLWSERFVSPSNQVFPSPQKPTFGIAGMHRHLKRVLENSWCSLGKQITFIFFFSLPGMVSQC